MEIKPGDEVWFWSFRGATCDKVTSVYEQMICTEAHGAYRRDIVYATEEQCLEANIQKLEHAIALGKNAELQLAKIKHKEMKQGAKRQSEL
jgi:hypothetical protein